MKWVGIATALISFGTAIYQLAHAEGELRDRKRVFQERLTSGRAQWAAGDFASAWDSFAHADSAAAGDGLFAKLLGGLGAEQRQVRTAQQDLAMEWIRSSRVPEGGNFSAITDKVTDVLAIGATSSGGARKADLLAHLGWAYFLKQRDGDGNLRPDAEYREAVAADALNPFANVFWGHWILWNHGLLKEANERFADALASGRARAEVRHFQLAALANVRSEDADAAWLSVVSDMRKSGETLDAATREQIYTRYSMALDDDTLMQRLLAAVSPSLQVELQRLLLQSADLQDTHKLTLTAAMAVALEAVGQREAALAAWRAVQADLKSQPGSTLMARANAAVRRLGRP